MMRLLFRFELHVKSGFYCTEFNRQFWVWTSDAKFDGDDWDETRRFLDIYSFLHSVFIFCTVFKTRISNVCK